MNKRCGERDNNINICFLDWSDVNDSAHRANGVECSSSGQCGGRERGMAYFKAGHYKALLASYTLYAKQDSSTL